MLDAAQCAKLLYEDGLKKYREGRPIAAIALYADALKTSPECIDALFELALLYQCGYGGPERMIKAAELYRQGNQIFPERRETWVESLQGIKETSKLLRLHIAYHHHVVARLPLLPLFEEHPNLIIELLCNDRFLEKAQKADYLSQLAIFSATNRDFNTALRLLFYFTQFDYRSAKETWGLCIQEEVIKEGKTQRFFSAGLPQIDLRFYYNFIYEAPQLEKINVLVELARLNPLQFNILLQRETKNKPKDYFQTNLSLYKQLAKSLCAAELCFPSVQLIEKSLDYHSLGERRRGVGLSIPPAGMLNSLPSPLSRL